MRRARPFTSGALAQSCGRCGCQSRRRPWVCSLAPSSVNGSFLGCRRDVSGRLLECRLGSSAFGYSVTDRRELPALPSARIECTLIDEGAVAAELDRDTVE